MAQFNRLQIGRRGREVLNDQSVIVTHVENPSLFFCRLLTEDEEFSRLEDIISRFVEQNQENRPNLSLTSLKNKMILAYSGIHKTWCRARIIASIQNSIAKVFLVDYGSIELMVFNQQSIFEATPEISSFNDGFGFCFPCTLNGILPFDEIKCKTTPEWSSYANFVMERQCKDRRFILSLRGNNSPGNNVVVCDLHCISDTHAQTERSLSQILVNANVAHFGPSDENDSVFVLEDNKENHFIAF